MKIIHTSDWHIGKIVNEFSMIPDQKHMINELIKLVEQEKPQVMIIAGDLYDRSIPPVEGVELLDETLSRLVNQHNIKVLATSGNHDSGGRLGFGSSILRKQGLYIAGDESTLYEKVVMKDGEEEVHFYLVPYKDPAVIRKLVGDKELRSHHDGMEAVIDKIKEELNPEVVNVLVAHGYITMKREAAAESGEAAYTVAELETSESERPLSIGGTDLIDGSLFSDFEYVALGHLHGRQQVGREGIRYSGSLLKYSFSEVNQRKGVTLIDIKDDQTLEISQQELMPRRDFRIIKGELQTVLEEGRLVAVGKEDYLQVVLTDEGELINPIESLRAVYPNVMMITRERAREYNEDDTSAKHGYKTKSEVALFEEFYTALGTGELTEEKQNVIVETINEVLKKGGVE